MIQSLQALRAFAALIVVFRHINTLYQKRSFELGLADSFLNPNHAFISYCEVGVDIFFVLSGFIIVYTSWDELSSKTFIKKRLLRIYPAYWGALAGVILIACLPGSVAVVNIHDLVYSILLWPHINSLDGGLHPMLGVGWTLSYEMLFYLIYCFIIGQTARTEKRVFALSAVMIGFVTLSLLFDSQAVWVKFLGRPVVLEFASGAILAVMYRHKMFIGREVAAALISLFACSWLFYSFSVDWHDVHEFFTMGLVSIGLIGACVLYPGIARMRIAPIWLWLGAASYSIYLVHGLPMQLISGMWKRGLFVPSGGFLLPGFIGLFIGLVALGGFYHIAFEKPLLRFGRRFVATESDR